MDEKALLLGQVDSCLQYTMPNGQVITVVQEIKLDKGRTVSDVGTALQRSIYSAVLIFAKEYANASNTQAITNIPQSGGEIASTQRSASERLLDVDGTSRE